MTLANIWVDRDNPAKSLAHVGQGKIVINVEIPGVGIYQSKSYTPTDSWFTTGWNSETGYLYDLLAFDGTMDQYRESASWLEADLKVSSIRIRIADVGGAMMSQIKAWKTRANCKLTISATSTDTAFSTTDTTDFAAGTALIWLGQECMKRTAKAAGGFTGLTRGYLNTLQQPHDVDDSQEPPGRPIITDGVHSLYRRSVYVHAAVVDPLTGQPGATKCIYRGRIKKGGKVGKGQLQLEVEHKIAVLADKVGQDMPNTELRTLLGPSVGQCWYSGLSLADSNGLSGNRFRVIVNADPVLVYADEEIIPDSGHYVTHYGTTLPWRALHEYWNIKSAALAIGYSKPHVDFDGSKFHLKCAATSAAISEVTVRRGDPLWALGFQAGIYQSGSGEAMDFPAQRDPVALLVDCTNCRAERPQLDVAESARLENNCRAQIPGNFAFKITSITTSAAGTFGTRHQITIDPHDGDYWGSVHFERSGLYYYVEDSEDAIIRHVIVLGKLGGLLSESSVMNALKILLGVARDETGVVEPRSWFPQDVRREDFDWDELAEAVSTVPVTWVTWYDVIIKPVEVWKVLGQWFALFGICPRLTDDGKIGFTRVSDLLSVEATANTELDADVWEGSNAAQVMVEPFQGPLVNQVIVEHSYDYRFEDGDPVAVLGVGNLSEWSGARIKIRNASGIAELAGVKSVGYKLRGWFPGASGVHVTEAAHLLKLQLRATHFSLYGLETGVATIPCTWIAKQYRLGDVVNVTHEVVPDVADGELGISSKPAKIEGAIRQVTKDRPDEVTIRYGATTHTAGIAPCALGDSYQAAQVTITCSNADTPLYEQSGQNDLTRFVSTSALQLIATEYNVANPTQWAVTAAAGGVDPDAKTVELTSDPFSGAFPVTGVWLTFADWDSADATQQSYAYSADTGSPPSLGAGSDTAKEWSI